MASLKSHPSKATNGVDYVDERSSLYFNKFQYRARITLNGLNRTYSSKNFLDFLKVIERVQMSDSINESYNRRMQAELEAIDLDSIDRYFQWRNTHVNTNKEAMIRVESNTAGVFSNDLALLKTLEKIYPGAVVDYTEVDQSIPQGTKYYVSQPPHNYRVYLKSKLVEPKVKEDLVKFIDRYKGTNTVIVPSGALNSWLRPNKNSQIWRWNMNYISSHYYIDFDDDSTNSLFSLMFGELIYRRFKLEKRPAVV